MEIDTLAPDTLQDHAGLSVNDSGTCEKSDTRLTRGRSPGVRPRSSGYVYFIRAGDAIKIGYSVRPIDRLKSLQAAHPGQMQILGTRWASMEFEKELHHYFAQYNIHGEWFRAAPAILKYIADNATDEVAAPPTTPSPPMATRLIALRVMFGADTPAGHACSNLVEQLKNYERASPDQQARLRKLIPEQMSRLSRRRE